MLDLMYLTIMKLTAVMAMTMFLMRTEIMKEAKTCAMMPMMLASLVMVTMVMVTTVMALLTILVAMTAMMLVTHLTVMTLLVKEKKKGKTVQQSMGGGDNNCGLDGPNHNETNSGDGNDNVLGGNRKNKEAKMLAMRTTLLARLVMVTMVMVTTVMALLTILVAMTAMMLLTHLTVVMLLVKSTVSVALVLLQDLQEKVPLEPYLLASIDQ
jgi:hypothetical protein